MFHRMNLRRLRIAPDSRVGRSSLWRNESLGQRVTLRARKWARTLHHSVDGDKRGGRQLHGRGCPVVGLVVVRSDRAAPISSIVARSVMPVYAVPSPNKDRTSAMSYSATEAESIAAL
jgi:hypothetical protein